MATTIPQLITTLETLHERRRRINPALFLWASLGVSEEHFADLLRTALGELLPFGAELKEMPYSEVCVHMQVAGKLMWVERVSNGSGAQLYTLDGRQYSFPITPGEAGLHLG